MPTIVRFVPAGLLGLAVVFTAAQPARAADLELKPAPAAASSPSEAAPGGSGFELAARGSRPVSMGGGARRTVAGGRAYRAGPAAGGRRAMPVGRGARPAPQMSRRPVGRPVSSARRPATGPHVNRVGRPATARRPDGRAAGNVQRPGRNPQGLAGRRPSSGQGASLPTGERLGPADPHPGAGGDRRRAGVGSAGDRDSRRQSRLPRPQERSQRQGASDPWPGYDRLPSGGRRVGPRPLGVGGGGFVNNPAPIQNAIGNRVGSPAERDRARMEVLRLRRELQRLADENRQLRDWGTQLYYASIGSSALPPELGAMAASEGGIAAFRAKIQNAMLPANVAEYDNTARQLADAEAYANSIEAWRGYR